MTNNINDNMQARFSNLKGALSSVQRRALEYRTSLLPDAFALPDGPERAEFSSQAADKILLAIVVAETIGNKEFSTWEDAWKRAMEIARTDAAFSIAEEIIKIDDTAPAMAAVILRGSLFAGKRPSEKSLTPRVFRTPCDPA